MTIELVIAVVSCIATVTGTVIALLSYLKKDKEWKIKAAIVSTTWRLFSKIVETTKWTWAFPFFQYTSTCFFLQEEKDLCGSVHNLPTLGLNFGQSLINHSGLRFLLRPSRLKAFLLFREQRIFKGNFSFLRWKENTLYNSQEKRTLLSVSLFSVFLLENRRFSESVWQYVF